MIAEGIAVILNNIVRRQTPQRIERDVVDDGKIVAFIIDRTRSVRIKTPESKFRSVLPESACRKIDHIPASRFETRHLTDAAVGIEIN